MDVTGFILSQTLFDILIIVLLLGVQFGAISKYLQISTLDASVLAPPDIQTALANFPNNFVLNVIDTQANITSNQLAIDTAGRGQAKITLQN